MNILAWVYAIIVIFVLVRPAIGPFSRQFQLAWDNRLGKLVIAGLFIALLIVNK